MLRIIRRHLRVSAVLTFIVSMMSCLQPGMSQTVSVLTQHNDLSRSGANPNETTLTTSNVSESTFGKLFSMPIDGFVYAQPLYVPQVSISSGTHNVLYVADAHDSVYAFDADTGTQYWHVSIGTPVPSSVINTQNILVEVGIIATPVIDTANNTMYVTAKTYENSVQIFRLHALNISTGAEEFGGPVEIAATISGSGVESSGGKVTFTASQENQRAAVSLINGVIYLAFASHEDHDPYHGWVLGYNPSTLAQVSVFNVTPNSGEGAIWMGGQGLVADSSNNIYLITSNSTKSTENASDDYGESFLKLVPSGGTLTVADYFKSNQYDNFNANDLDLGSTGAFLIPGTTYIAGGSKVGKLYVVNTANMGKLDTSTDQVVQEFQATNGLWGNPAFWNNTMYIWGVNEPLKAYSFNGNTFNTSPSSQSAYSTPGGTTSGTVSVSSNRTTPGTEIVWATAPTGDPDHATVGGNLYAYSATNLGTLLWSTSSNSSRDSYGDYAKFCAPTIANGKVYVGTDSGQVVAYGLLSTAADLIPNGAYVIKSVYSGLAIGDPGSSDTDSVVMEQLTVTNGANEQWTVDNLGGNVITLKNRASGQMLDVTGDSKATKALVDQYPANGHTNQQWNVISIGGGNFELTSVNSGLTIDVVGGVKTVGAKIDQYTYQGKAWQQWSFVAP